MKAGFLRGRFLGALFLLCSVMIVLEGCNSAPTSAAEKPSPVTLTPEQKQRLDTNATMHQNAGRARANAMKRTTAAHQ